MKTLLKPLQFLKSTPLYDWWLGFRNPEYGRAKARERSFYQSLLPAGALVFDIGANMGQKTRMFQQLGHPVVSVEPDPSNFELLTRKFGKGRVALMKCAVSDTIGESEFHVESPGSAYNTLSDKWRATLENPDANRWNSKLPFEAGIKVKTVTLDHIISLHGHPYYIKIDVEGYEYMALKGLSKAVPLLSFECNLPEFLDETLLCLEHLHGLDPDARYNICINDESFELPDPIPFKAIYDKVAKTDLRYLEIFCLHKERTS